MTSGKSWPPLSLQVPLAQLAAASGASSSQCPGAGQTVSSLVSTSAGLRSRAGRQEDGGLSQEPGSSLGTPTS